MTSHEGAQPPVQCKRENGVSPCLFAPKRATTAKSKAKPADTKEDSEDDSLVGAEQGVKAAIKSVEWGAGPGKESVPGVEPGSPFERLAFLSTL